MQLGNRERERSTCGAAALRAAGPFTLRLVVRFRRPGWSRSHSALRRLFLHGFLVPVLAAVVIGFASWPIFGGVQGVNGNRTLAATIAIISVVLYRRADLARPIYAVDEVRDWLVWAVATNANGAPAPAWLATIPVGGCLARRTMGQICRSPRRSRGVGAQLVSGSNIGISIAAWLWSAPPPSSPFLTLFSC